MEQEQRSEEVQTNSAASEETTENEFTTFFYDLLAELRY